VPRFPDLDSIDRRLKGSVFSALAQKIASLEGEVCPLHIGDTWLELDPLFDARQLEDVEPNRPHRYSNPIGIPAFLEAVVEKVRFRNNIAVEGPENVVATVGATGGLYLAARIGLSAGDEVLILTPHWPQIRSIATVVGGVPVEVPLVPGEDDADVVRTAIEEKLSPRTAAIYINTPCNPTGTMLREPALAAISDFARSNDLWIWSDEVYDEYAFADEHVSIAVMAPERTLTVYAMSKAYGMAGYRCGYLVGPEDAISAARKVATYAWYSVPTPAQLAAIRAFEHGDAWLTHARDSYQSVGRQVADSLALPHPEGSTFLFPDVAAHLDDRGIQGFLEDCLDDNVVLAPGISFGDEFQTHVRLCFTCAPPDVVLRGVRRLATRMGMG
jgi:N-succinyldiaminopimelate aminotransferase